MINLQIIDDVPEREAQEFWDILSAVPTNIYDDVAELQEKVAALEAANTDSGWITLPLQNGATAYNTAQIPQYRKIGNKVYIRGVFKGITEPCVVATLPEGFRPSQRIIYCLPRTGASLTRFEIELNGDVKYSTSPEIISEITWFSFSDISFFTD